MVLIHWKKRSLRDKITQANSYKANTMKVIIAGSRSITDTEAVEAAVLRSPFSITEVISGHAAGVDTIGEALSHKLQAKLVIFHANWRLYGKSAGFTRNSEMADYADALILIWNGLSRGSADMKRCMEERKKPIFEVIL